MENELNFLNPEKFSFYETESALLALKSIDEDYGRVAVLRMFPFKYDEEYLSVRIENYNRGDKNSEIGIIRDLSEFSEKQVEFVRKELKRRYFVPIITAVKKVKEEFGNTMWEVKTTAGDREFTVNDMGSNLINLDDGRILLIDIYGNRYIVNDMNVLGDKAMQIIEIWI